MKKLLIKMCATVPVFLLGIGFQAQSQVWNIPALTGGGTSNLTGIGTTNITAHSFDILAGGLSAIKVKYIPVNGSIPANTNVGVAGALYWNAVGSDFANALNVDQGGAIELGGGGSTTNANPVTGGKPYMDFHYGTGAYQDYNVRIMNSGDGKLDIFNQSGTGISIYSTYPLTVNGSTYPKLIQIDNVGNVNYKMYGAASAFNINSTGTNPVNFMMTGSSSNGEWSGLRVGVAKTSGNSCGGCYSDVAKLNDVVISSMTNSTTAQGIIGANLILTNHSNQGSIKFSTKNNTNFSAGDIQRMEITYDGRVIIGNNDADLNNDFNTTNTVNNMPSGYKLYVSQGIITPKLKIGLPGTSSWSDFVFEKDYKLKTLEEVERYIQSNKHLPEVPSAKEVGENGIDVAKMDALLLQKIEELTLYLIEIKKENNEMKEKIKELKNVK
jgi:hypothetical protein